MNMNKYQEALNGLVNVKENFIYHEGKMIQIKNIGNAKLLQELVDKVPHYEKLESKATPKKPIKARNGDIICGNCKESAGIFTKYIEQTTDETFDGEIEFDYHIEYTENEFCSICGQALDWSEK